MSVLINKQKDEVILTCKCGCDDAVHIKVIHDDLGYAFLTFMNGSFYRDQCSGLDLLKRKVRKIWAILVNRDYYYSEIILSESDFEEFRKYISEVGRSEKM